MEIGVKPDPVDSLPRAAKKRPLDPSQKTKLTNYFVPHPSKNET